MTNFYHIQLIREFFYKMSPVYGNLISICSNVLMSNRLTVGNTCSGLYFWNWISPSCKLVGLVEVIYQTFKLSDDDNDGLFFKCWYLLFLSVHAGTQ